MAQEYWNEYKGISFQKDGKCYCYIGPSFDVQPNRSGSVDETYSDCDDCPGGPTAAPPTPGPTQAPEDIMCYDGLGSEVDDVLQFGEWSGSSSYAGTIAQWLAYQTNLNNPAYSIAGGTSGASISNNSQDESVITGQFKSWLGRGGKEYNLTGNNKGLQVIITPSLNDTNKINRPDSVVLVYHVGDIPDVNKAWDMQNWTEITRVPLNGNRKYIDVSFLPRVDNVYLGTMMASDRDTDFSGYDTVDPWPYAGGQGDSSAGMTLFECAGNEVEETPDIDTNDGPQTPNGVIITSWDTSEDTLVYASLGYISMNRGDDVDDGASNQDLDDQFDTLIQNFFGRQAILEPGASYNSYRLDQSPNIIGQEPYMYITRRADKKDFSQVPNSKDIVWRINTSHDPDVLYRIYYRTNSSWGPDVDNATGRHQVNNDFFFKGKDLSQGEDLTSLSGWNLLASTFGGENKDISISTIPREEVWLMVTTSIVQPGATRPANNGTERYFLNVPVDIDIRSNTVTIPGPTEAPVPGPPDSPALEPKLGYGEVTDFDSNAINAIYSSLGTDPDTRWDNVESQLDNPNSSPLVGPGLLAGYGESDDPPGFSRLQRGAVVIDNTEGAVPGDLSIEVDMATAASTEGFVLLYTTGGLPTTDNPLWAMKSWNIIGYLTTFSDDISIDLSSLPKVADLVIGLMTIPDFENRVKSSYSGDPNTGLNGTPISGSVSEMWIANGPTPTPFVPTPTPNPGGPGGGPATETMYATDAVGSNFYSVDPVTANRTLIANFGTTMRGLVWDENTQTLYANESGGAWYSVNTDTGALTLLNGGTPNTMADGTNDPNTGDLYTVAWSEYYRVDDPTNGTFTFIQNTPGSDPGAALITHNGQSYIARNGSIYTVDLPAGTYGPAVNFSGDFSGSGLRAMAEYNGTVYAIDIVAGGGDGRLITLDPATGVCTLVGGAGQTWLGLAVERIPIPQQLYATDGTNFYTVDEATGNFTLVGPTGVSNIHDIAEDPTTGILYGIAYDGSFQPALYTINRDTGAATLVGADGSSFCPPASLLFDDGGQGYQTEGAGCSGGAYNSIDKSTGALSFIGSLTSTGGGGAPIVQIPGGLAYYANGGNIYELTLATGVLGPAQALAGGIDVRSLAYFDGTLYGVQNDGSGVGTLITIDPGTGAVATIGGSKNFLGLGRGSVSSGGAVPTPTPTLPPPTPAPEPPTPTPEAPTPTPEPAPTIPPQPPLNQADIGTPSGNPTMILYYAAGPSSNSNFGVNWNPGDVRRLHPDAYQFDSETDLADPDHEWGLTTGGSSLQITDATGLLASKVAQIIFNVSGGIINVQKPESGPVSISNSPTTVHGPDPELFVVDQIIGDDQRYNLAEFDNGELWFWYKGENWPDDPTPTPTPGGPTQTPEPPTLPPTPAPTVAPTELPTPTPTPTALGPTPTPFGQFLYEAVSDSEALGSFATDKQFIWAQAASGQFVKAQRLGGTATPGSDCFFAPDNPVTADDLTINDFPDQNFDSLTFDNDCNFEEVGLNSGIPPRALANGGVRYTNGAGSPYEGVQQAYLGNNGVQTNEDFAIVLDCETEDVGVSPVGQVSMVLGMSFSDGSFGEIGVRHRTSAAEPNPKQKFNYRTDVSGDWVSLFGTTGDFSGLMSFVRNGTSITMSMGPYEHTFTVGASATISSLYAYISDGNGANRSQPWYATFKQLTIASALPTPTPTPVVPTPTPTPVVPTPTPTPTVPVSTIKFNGSNRTLLPPDRNQTDNFSIVARFNPPDASSNKYIIQEGNVNSFGNYYGFQLIMQTDRTIQFRYGIGDNTGFYTAVSTNLCDLNSENLVVVSRSGGVVRIGINGSFEEITGLNTSPIVYDPVSSNHHISIGARKVTDSTTDNYSNISLTNLFFIKKVLSTSEENSFNVSKHSWQYSKNIRDFYVLALNSNGGAASGREFRDYSGLNLDIQNVGSVDLTGDTANIADGNKVNTFGFSGNRYINLGNPASLQTAGAKSFMFWAKPSGSGAVLLSKHHASTSNGGYFLSWNNYVANQFQFNLRDSGGERIVYSNTLTPGRWYFVCATYDGTDLKMYVNGVLHNTVNTPGWNTPNTLNNFEIGRNADNGETNYTGDMTKVIGADRAFSQSEIKIAFNQNTAKSFASYLPSNLVFAYEMTSDDDSLVNISGSGPNGTAVNGAAADSSEMNIDDSPFTFSIMAGRVLNFDATKYLKNSSALYRLPSTGTMTVAFQVDKDSPIGTDGAFMSSWTGNGWMVYTNDGSTYRFYTNGSILDFDVSSLSGILNIVCVKDGANRSVYINGELVASDSSAPALVASTRPGGEINNYGNAEDRAGNMQVCALQLFNTAKTPEDMFYGETLKFLADDADLVFGITGIEANQELTDQSSNSISITNTGGVAADGIESLVFLEGTV